MPTKENIQRLEALLEAAAVLIDTKKAMDRLDQEIRTQKKLLGLIEDQDSQADAAGEGEGEDEQGGEKGGDAQVAEEEAPTDPMDIDREQPVAIPDIMAESTSRRQVRASICFCAPFYMKGNDQRYCKSQNHKRSLSISSVETSATAATRASRSNKRARKT